MATAKMAGYANTQGRKLTFSEGASVQGGVVGSAPVQICTIAR
jgi:hypothetical protein